MLTSRGILKARKVLLATNGYSGALSPWHRRRVIPIGSYQIATEPLGAERVLSLIPRGRNIVDSRRVVVYFRPSADGERIIFGGRAALAETDPLACVPRLRAMMTRIFPQLQSVRITHAWVGWVAYTFDTMPHWANATAYTTAWAIAAKACRSLHILAIGSDSKWPGSSRVVPLLMICRSHPGLIISAPRGFSRRRCGHIEPGWHALRRGGISMTGKRHLNKYGSYAELARYEVQGRDYRVRASERPHSPLLIVAPHGGMIEIGTSEIAHCVAGNEYSVFSFEGLKPYGGTVTCTSRVTNSIIPIVSPWRPAASSC